MSTFKKSSSGFPMLAVILLVIAVVWLINDLRIISINLPWIPLVLIVVALGMIVNRYKK